MHPHYAGEIWKLTNHCGRKALVHPWGSGFITWLSRRHRFPKLRFQNVFRAHFKKQAFFEFRRINFWKAPFSVDRRLNFRIKTASSNSCRNLTLHSFSVPTKSLASVSEILSSRLIKTFLCFSVMHGLSCQVSNKNISFKNKQTFVIMLIHSVGINLFTLPWEWWKAKS